MPKITTYRTIDSTTTTPVLPHRGTPQRTIHPPVAEVAPTPKQNLIDQSPPSPMSIEKLAINMQQQQQQSNNKGLRKIESLKMPATSTEFNNVRDKFQNQISQQQQRQSQSPVHNNNQNRRNVEVKKKVWSVDTPDQQQMTYHSNGNGHYLTVQQQNGIDYRQAFLKQQEEVQSLRELMLLKDNRIRLLEDELRLLKNQYEHHPKKELTR